MTIITMSQCRKMIVRAEETKQTQRINLHPDVDDPVHEMLICHPPNIFVPWHKHPTKAVSFHLLQGSATVVYRANLETTEVNLSCDEIFFLRLPPDTWYHQEITSNCFLFLETIRGPWKPEDTVWDR